MKLTARIKDLDGVLKKTKLTVSPNDTNLVLQNFALRAEDNKLTIIATDLQLATVCEMEAAVTRPGVTTLPGTKFIQIVSATSSDNIEIELDPTSQHATLRTGAYNARLVTLPFDDYPKIEDFKEENAVMVNREELVTKLDRISFSVADSETRKNLMVVYINDGLMQASDGSITTVCEFDKAFKDTLIPALAVKDLSRVLHASNAKEVSLCQTDKFLLFKIGPDTFMTRLSGAKFPDIIKKILKPTEQNKIAFKANRQKLRAAINRIGVTSNDKNMSICLDLQADKATLSSSDAIGNSSTEDIDITFNGDPQRTHFNFTRLIDICDAMSNDDIEFKMSDNRRVPVRVEEANPLFISFLMRLADQVVTAPRRAADTQGDNGVADAPAIAMDSI